MTQEYYMYQIKTDFDSSVKPKRFTQGGKHFFYIRISLAGTTEDLDKVELVKYTLHPTFKDRVRASDKRPANFEIRIWTYGFFDITALLIKRDGTTEEVTGYVRWDIPEGTPFDDGLVDPAAQVEQQEHPAKEVEPAAAQSPEIVQPSSPVPGEQASEGIPTSASITGSESEASAG